MVALGGRVNALSLAGVAGFAVLLLGLVSVFNQGASVGSERERRTELIQLAFKPANSAAPGAVSSIYKGELLSIDVPASQLSQSRVGDVVKGKLAAADGGHFDFSGAIAGGTELSPTQGAVTIRVISDTYISPGTEVSGRVGNKMFSGTVTG
jgi:hypothetical protein